MRVQIKFPGEEPVIYSMHELETEHTVTAYRAADGDHVLIDGREIEWGGEYAPKLNRRARNPRFWGKTNAFAR